MKETTLTSKQYWQRKVVIRSCAACPISSALLPAAPWSAFPPVETPNWNHCEHKHALGVFHCLLKVVYLQGKQNRCLDHLISIILKVARDKGFEQLQKLHKGKTSHRACELNKRHKKADEMMSSGESPTLRSAKTWEAPSQSNPHSVHVVQAQTNHNCTCKLVSGGCKLCAYAYTCTCRLCIA